MRLKNLRNSTLDGLILKTSNSSKRCILEFDFEYTKESCKLHIDYPLTSDKIEINREILSEYQLNIAH